MWPNKGSRFGKTDCARERESRVATEERGDFLNDICKFARDNIAVAGIVSSYTGQEDLRRFAVKLTAVLVVLGNSSGTVRVHAVLVMIVCSLSVFFSSVVAWLLLWFVVGFCLSSFGFGGCCCSLLAPAIFIMIHNVKRVCLLSDRNGG